MHCPSCYKPISDTDRNCPHCGASLSMFNPPSAHPVAPGGDVGAGAYAGFWRRVGAYLIDSLVLILVYLAILVPLFVTGTLDVKSVDQHELPIDLVSLVFGWLYFALQESSAHQATLGKRFFGMQVTDVAGNRLTFGRATGRYFAKILSTIVLLIGFLMVAFTQRKQGLHDMVASTLVVDRAGAPRRAGCAVVVAVFLLLVPFVAGILAALAIPAYQDYVKRANEARAQMEEQVDEGEMAAATSASVFAAQGDAAAAAVTASYAANGVMPTSLEETDFVADPQGGVVAGIGENGSVTLFSTDGQAHMTMLAQVAGDGTVGWVCTAEGVPMEEWPQSCQR